MHQCVIINRPSLQFIKKSNLIHVWGRKHQIATSLHLHFNQCHTRQKSKKQFVTFYMCAHMRLSTLTQFSKMTHGSQTTEHNSKTCTHLHNCPQNFFLSHAHICIFHTFAFIIAFWRMFYNMHRYWSGSKHTKYLTVPLSSKRDKRSEISVA